MTMGARAWLNPAIVASYPVGAARSLRRRWIGPRRWPGDARAICAAVIERCWNGEYLAASGGHFRQFWTRDLGFSAGALVRLGQGERVVASLAWALETWKARRHHITTTVFGGRRPADVYAYGIDSLPLFLWARRSASCAGRASIGRFRSGTSRVARTRSRRGRRACCSPTTRAPACGPRSERSTCSSRRGSIRPPPLATPARTSSWSSARAPSGRSSTDPGG